MFFRLSVRRIVSALLLLNFFLFGSIYLVSWWSSPPEFVLNHPYFLFDLDVEDPRSPGQKCILPRLHPFDPSIWKFLTSNKDVTCKIRQGELTHIDDSGRLIFNYSEVEKAGYEVDKSLFCHWSPVLRDPPDGDDKVAYGNEEHVPKDGYKLPHGVDFIRVQCKNFALINVYEKLHTTVQIPKSISEASLKHPVNVLIFGIDSLSRLAFIRHLPRTYRYLTESLNMTVMRGMNKVGDNSFPNLIPILTGHKAYGGGLGGTSDFFDHWPLIWKNFSQSGYGTFFAEDFIEYGLFNYLAKGFHKPPTDHYMRTYWLAIEESNLLKKSSHMCYGSLPKYFVQLDYLRRFVDKYEEAKTPYFGFSFLAEISHDYMSRVSSADVHFEKFFMDLHSKGYLKNTVFIVMSDHGHRFDSIRSTQVGHIEERMPFHAIYIPETITYRQPDVLETLSINSGRLVTPFDVHATLVDVLHFAKSGQPLGKTNFSSVRLGQSFFKEVPDNRTCLMASIPVHYCTCETDSEISVEDIRVLKAVDATLQGINQLIEEGGLSDVCSILSLKSILSAHLVHTAEELDTKIRVMIQTKPSNGVFEALISMQNGAAKVIGDISRINPYNSQSRCIKHVILRKYCYCTDHPKRKMFDSMS